MSKENKLTIAFSGDIAFSKYYKDRCGVKDLVDPEIVKYLNDADHAVLNVEGAISPPPPAGLFIHTNNPLCIDWLNKLGGDVYMLANNHMFDAGTDGFLFTKKVAKENNVQTIGAGLNVKEAAAPVYFPEAGGIGMFGMGYAGECKLSGKETPGTLNWNQDDAIKSTIAEIKKTCRWCVAVIHAGVEFCDIPMGDVRSKYLKFLEWGVDIIVAHHPHIPQNYELFDNGKAIFYSLGNFIFDTDYQRTQERTDTGILLKLSFTEKDFSMDALAVHINRADGHVTPTELPTIFCDLHEPDYDVLLPLVAEKFIYREKNRRIYLSPDKYGEKTTEAEWEDYFERRGKKTSAVKAILDQYDRGVPGSFDPKYAELVAYIKEKTVRP